MNYYKVWPANLRYHGTELLTYAADNQTIEPGTVVVIPLRSASILAIVVSKTTKPIFAVKDLSVLSPAIVVPPANLALLEWFATYYPSPYGVLGSMFLPRTLSVKQAESTPVEVPSATIRLPNLTEDQQRAIKEINESAGTMSLLHGVTGSGKTRVYLELAEQTLRQRRSVLVLTPEIALTSSLVDTFRKSLTCPVLVVHSRLTDRERRIIWLQILKSSDPVVVIGARSALFSPFSSLGLLVVDEFHDNAYKQDQSPYYQTVRVAGRLAELHQATLVLGSATPTVSDYYVAVAKKRSIIRLRNLAIQSETIQRPTITTIDLRDKSNFARSPIFSDALLKGIEDSLARKEQSLVFLNRRGTARLVLCQKCGWQALCPNCDLPLTYHADTHIMRCHTCGHTSTIVTSCPTCQSIDIVYRSVGTKALETGLKKILPHAKIQRFDTDNKKAERFEQQYDTVMSGDVDIIVGTQMLIKGHDLPKLSMVGVVAADTSLYFPDFSAEEQTYQLITQVIGRVGRGHRQGNVVVQTYNPDSPAIRAAINGDWEGFYEKQIDERRLFAFPPFVQTLKLRCSRASQQSAMKACTELLSVLNGRKLPVKLIGPAPAFVEKVGNKYVWQIIVKAKSRAPLLEIVRCLPANWSYDLDPTNLL